MNSKITALIVDDEHLARENLRMMVDEYCQDITVVGTAGSAEEAEKFIETHNPQIVFLDIRMPSGAEGLDMINRIDNPKFLVVFVTAFKEYAIEAFNANAIHYLLKPIDLEDLIKVNDKIKAVLPQRAENPVLPQEYMATLKRMVEDITNKSSKQNKITINHSGGIKIVNKSTITHLTADGNCTHIYFKDGSRYIDTRTLKIYDGLLDHAPFMRVHKSHIVNIDYVNEYSSKEGHYAVLSSNLKVPISRANVKDFIERIR